MSERFTGSMRVVTPMALQAMGTIYRYNTEVIEQYVENGYDAGAKEIIVSLERGKIAIFDNGHGLVPRMTQEDYDTLSAYKADIEAQKIPWELPLEVLFPELVDSPSLRSFQWMMECYGLSSKRISNEPRARGAKGIGTLSFQQIANRVIWYSRPSSELASKYWHSSILSQYPPTHYLRSATVEELRRHVISYEIDSADSLKDPLGRDARSGTLVELTELREGIERSLRPPQVIRSLQERFGNDIRSDRLKILVVDRVTDEGIKTGGQILEVPPATYPGTLIFKREASLRSGRGPFDVELYYDPLSNRFFPKLLRKGSEVCSITALLDFNKHPWNIGKLSGIVSYPDLPDTEAPWDASKSLPLAGPVYNQWQRRVWEMAEEIQKEIEKINEDLRLNQLEDFASILSRETVEAMSEIPSFADLVIKKKSVTQKGRKPRGPETRVIATVLNENDDGVSGTKINLHNASNDELIREAVTKRTGVVSLGRYPFGRYRLRLTELPEGARIEGMDSYLFNLSVNMPGIKEIFRLITGEPKRPRPRPINQIEPFFRKWANVDEPYTQRLEYGVVEINTEEGTRLRDAIDRGDLEARAILCVQYMSSAVAEFAAAEDEDREETLIKASNLFGVLLRRISTRTRGRSQ